MCPKCETSLLARNVMEKQSNCCLAVKEASKESDIQVGHRIEILKERGFVRFIGSLDSPDKDPSILWLGIEWDDHTRGKHYGTYCGKQYFHCKRNKGSFIKLMEVEKNPRKDFMEALLSKYCFDNLEEISHSSNVFRGNKTAEFVGFYKVFVHFSNFEAFEKHL